MCREELDAESSLRCMPAGATRDQRYIELMRTMQFETFEMLAECAESGFRFTVPYHFEGTVRAAGERTHPTRMKRLAQEASTLATSLPLSYSSSVFRHYVKLQEELAKLSCPPGLEDMDEPSSTDGALRARPGSVSRRLRDDCRFERSRGFVKSQFRSSLKRHS
ncbi:Survivin [Operophtera brumata]|uniref:Survivin n=1 Tax=Operophtera brumata TaxID=104452 RepID=A0A0L7LRJ1_OPEBR|nr:Survivin [Operophtera brumata]